MLEKVFHKYRRNMEIGGIQKIQLMCVLYIRNEWKISSKYPSMKWYNHRIDNIYSITSLDIIFLHSSREKAIESLLINDFCVREPEIGWYSDLSEVPVERWWNRSLCISLIRHFLPLFFQVNVFWFSLRNFIPSGKYVRIYWFLMR